MARANWSLMVRAHVRVPLRTCERAENFVRAAVAAAEMNVIGGPWAVMGTIPGNEGVSATAILDFSSVNLHEWPWRDPWPLIHFDLFTCGARPNPARFFDLFSRLDLAAFDAEIIDRDAIFGGVNPL